MILDNSSVLSKVVSNSQLCNSQLFRKKEIDLLNDGRLNYHGTFGSKTKFNSTNVYS